MFATVKKIIIHNLVYTKGHADSFTHGMKKFCGKRIKVVPLKGCRGWFDGNIEGGTGYNWHSSWLTFAAKSTKVGRLTSHNKRSTARKPRPKSRKPRLRAA